MMVYVDLDLDQDSYERRYYNYLDLLSDVGGLLFILVSFTSSALSIIKHNRVANYLATSLYSARNPLDTNANSRAAAELLNPPICSNITGFCIDSILPRCCTRQIKGSLHWKKRALEEAR